MGKNLWQEEQEYFIPSIIGGCSKDSQIKCDLEVAILGFTGNNIKVR
jgi:hypothetical protein